MSLDVYLTKKRDEPTDADRACKLLREHGFNDFADELEARHEHGDIEVYTANITHNLNRMAEAAGIYKCLWRPEEIGITKASQVIEPLAAGIEAMKADRARYELFNPSNGWGSYEVFVPWCERYLEACRENPDADVYASR